jgi:hypothetical protein
MIKQITYDKKSNGYSKDKTKLEYNVKIKNRRKQN